MHYEHGIWDTYRIVEGNTGSTLWHLLFDIQEEREVPTEMIQSCLHPSIEDGALVCHIAGRVEGRMVHMV